EGRPRPVRRDGARNAQRGQDRGRPHLQLSHPAVAGRRALPHHDAGGFNRRAPARQLAAQTGNSLEMTNDPIIKFDKVVKRFGDLTVLNELDFEVGKGEKVSIIGPSGSGKSTVLRILMTLESIDGGMVTVGGEPLWHEPGPDGLKPASEAHLSK